MAINSTKRLSVFSGIIALLALLPTIAFALTVKPTVDNTYIHPFSNINSKFSVSPPTRLASHQRFQPNTEQREKIQALREQRNKHIQAVLNPSQQTKFSGALRVRKGVRTALKSLNLTPKQKTRIQSIMQAYNQQAKAVVYQTAAEKNHN